GVSSTGVEGENRYGHLDVELVLDLGDLEEERRAKLAERVDRTSGRLCTVGRTLKAGATCGGPLTPAPARGAWCGPAHRPAPRWARSRHPPATSSVGSSSGWPPPVPVARARWPSGSPGTTPTPARPTSSPSSSAASDGG